MFLSEFLLHIKHPLVWAEVTAHSFEMQGLRGKVKNGKSSLRNYEIRLTFAGGGKNGRAHELNCVGTGLHQTCFFF